jgi:hypothetical protein
MLWGASGGGGAPFDASGVASVNHRDPGPHRLALRQTSDQPKPWNYILAIRSGVTDTVVLDFRGRCEQLFKQPGD